MTTTVAKTRDDLLYYPDPKDENRGLVKDPIRRQFFRYNALQIEMMKALDGTRTIEQVKAFLDEKFEGDIPAISIERFVARLQANLLLDVASYTVEDRKTREQILRRLRKRKLALRVKARDNTSREAQLFEAGTRELHDGDPCKAAAYFQQVLEVNPANERARQILLATHEAFFKTNTAGPSHAFLVHLWNPHRVLSVIDRLIGRFIFTRWGFLAVVVLLLATIPAALATMAEPALVRPLGVFDVVMVFATMQLIIFFHELCHGLACVHYGGRVDDMGWMWMYGSIMPGGYCDTSDSYLFADRRPKIVVQFAGPLGSLAQQAVLFHVLGMLDPSLAIWQGVALANCIVIYWNFVSVVPFLKYDAYYAVAEYLGMANLRERSFEYLRASLAKRIFNVDVGVKVTPRERRIFGAFALLSALYTVIFYYRVFIRFLLPHAVDLLGTVGIVVAAVLMVKWVGRPVVVGTYKLIGFCVRNRRTIFTPVRSVVFAGVVTGIVLGLRAPWPLRVDATVYIEPTRQAEVRVVEPGLVQELKVRTGDRVRAGQVIAVLRSDELMRDHALAMQDLTIEQTRLELLQRGARAEEVRLATAQARVEQVKSAVAARRASDARQMRALEVASDATLAHARSEASHTTGQARVSLAAADIVRAAPRAEEIEQAEAGVRRWREKVAELDARVRRLEITSPIDGVIVTAHVEERAGTWLERGSVVLTVHDTSGWRARIVPDRGEPVGDLAIGQRVLLAAVGDPNEQVEATIAEILPPTDEQSTVVIYTSPLVHDGWRGGMTGQGRIYAPERSVAYRLFVMPIGWLLDYKLPSI